MTRRRPTRSATQSLGPSLPLTGRSGGGARSAVRVGLLLLGLFCLAQAPSAPGSAPAPGTDAPGTDAPGAATRGTEAFDAAVPLTEPTAASGAQSPTRMTVGQSIILGIVEGITEYLPISSTGHLILTQRAMGIAESDVANAYAICIQGGAILAVLLLYYGRFKSMARGLFGYDRQGGRMALNLIVALAPLIVVVFLEEYIKEHLFGLWSVTLAWFVGGVAILAVSYSRSIKNRPPGAGRDLTLMTWRMALIIGAAQCIAVWPGVSRSLVTIVGGVLVGLSLPAAVEFSFILGVVTLLGATVKDAIEYGPAMLDAYGPTAIIAGFLSAFLAAFLAVQWLVAYLQRHGMAIFGYYRVALAAVVAVLILMEVI